ncbi:hypothetical protein CC78DRAFT_537209 [Lojkania enalia]|uniref:Glycine cleavage system H protein n=1 Tax=Lojkania enalia TaxID=147567 RepID=A0A9P4K0W4_9PLEO|nr:hypothetical protein CC78DRAFT_537209 [Didymosphaeria enalia]
MASRVSIIRAIHQLTSSASRRPAVYFPSLSCQHAQRALLQRRLFSVSSTFKEKKYTEDHEWIEFSADGKACTLGISKYAAEALGDVVYIELPEVDMEVSSGDAIGAVESVKSAADILTPIGGQVTEVNRTLEGTPGQVNKDPEGEGWIAKLKVEGEPGEKMMSKEEYAAFTEEA